jgi:hypothetical protein
MKKCWKLHTIDIGLLALLLLQSGCATHKVAGRWPDHPIVIDGADMEWQGTPQFYDQKRHLAVRVVNDARALFLCIAAGDDAPSARPPGMTGLTLWIDPQGGRKKIFGIQLRAGGPGRPDRGPGPGAAAGPPNEKQEHPLDGEGPPPVPEAGRTVAIKYADATGPLQMSIAEVRRTGIDIGRGTTRGRRRVYEFRIDFVAAPSLADLKPGMVVGIGIQLGTDAQNGRDGAPPQRSMGRGGPGGGMGRRIDGGMGGGPGGPHPDGKDNAFIVWLQVRLADRI